MRGASRSIILRARSGGATPTSLLWTRAVSRRNEQQRPATHELCSLRRPSRPIVAVAFDVSRGGAHGTWPRHGPL